MYNKYMKGVVSKSVSEAHKKMVFLDVSTKLKEYLEVIHGPKIHPSQFANIALS